MKSSKSEIVYFILTIMVLAVAGFLYVFFGNRHQVQMEPTTQFTATTNSEDTKKEANKETKEKPEDVRLAEEHLSKLETEFSSENLATAQAAIDVVENTATKEELQGKLNALATEFEAVTNAEQLVIQSENFLSSVNYETALNAVNALSKEDKKKELLNRLAIVKQNIDAYNQANGLVGQQ